MKSLRAGHASLVDAFVQEHDGELMLHGLRIPEHAYGRHGTRALHQPRRTRKLLMHRSEIDKITGRLGDTGVTLVALSLYFQDGWAKVENSLTSTVIRPAWFMEDFSETFLQPVNDEIVVPAGDGAESFVSVEDIAAIAAVTLTEPEKHAGRAYAPTGPQALTMAEAAVVISAAAGRTITYRNTDREQWIAAMVSIGIPAEYAAVLRPLTATVASGNGARPNSDVLDVTGTAPVTFAEFAARTAQAWK